MSLDGILVVNKPEDWTSYDVCNFVKRRFKVNKVGHTGTLDPQATGVLVLLLGRYTKMSAKLMAEEKVYDGVILLGVETDTHDMAGNVVSKFDISGITEDSVKNTAKKFLGEIMQIPPMYSAIKKGGKKLYELARAGIVVEREPRKIIVKEFNIKDIFLPDVYFSVVVSKGAYIRTLAHDLGKELGVGAVLKTLERVRNGRFSIEESHTIDELKKTDKSELEKFLYKFV